MKFKSKRIFLSLICVLCLLFALPFTALAKGVKAEVSEYDLSVILPEGSVPLTESVASKESELIESFGYTVTSFKNYLKTNQIILFASAPDGTQISVKRWESDFSADAEDMSYLSDTALTSVAKQLVTLSGATYKTVLVNSMKLIEIRSNGKDSGGDFSSVQYITIRNGAFYSVNIAFSGKLDDTKVQSAWDIICGLKIKDNISKSPWTFSAVFEMVLICVLIIAAIVAAVLVILSFVKDIRSKRANTADEVEYIERRDRF